MLELFSNSKAGASKAVRGLRTKGETGTVKVGAIDIAYWLARGGPNTIVFLHGNSAGKEVFYKQFEALAGDDQTLLAIDLPGHGASSDSKTPETDYSFPAFALLINQVLTELGIRSPICVGWSLGGHVVIEMAGRGFDMAGAMIFGTPPMGPGLGPDFEKGFRQTPAMAVTLNPSPTKEELATYVKGLYGSFAPPSSFMRLALRMDGAVRANMGAHWAVGDQGCHQRTVVAGWAKPLAVLHGDDDEFVSGDYLDSLTVRKLWRGQIHHFRDVGHAPFVEMPDEFNHLLSEFAREVFHTKRASRDLPNV